MQTIKDLAEGIEQPAFDTPLSTFTGEEQHLFDIEEFTRQIAYVPKLFQSGHGYPVKDDMCMIKSLTIETLIENFVDTNPSLVPVDTTHILWFHLNNIYINELDELRGDLMTVDEFKENVSYGLFTDDDGYGNPVKDNECANINVIPSRLGRIPFNATHILWYNR